MSRVTAEMYLQMWLSEQIPADQWLEILETNRKVNARLLLRKTE